jgi:hypothetical protein
MSLHTGEPVVGEEGYVGIDVVRAARICAAGHGGQVLLSATTAALVAGRLPQGVAEVDLGEHRLKDLDEPERVYQLEIDGLPAAFPPLRTHGEEPLDFEARLERRIQDEVEQMVEQALSGRPGGTPPADDQPEKLAKLAGVGLLVAFFGVLVLAGIVVVLALVVRALF